MKNYNSEYICHRRHEERSNPGVHGASEHNELVDIKNDIIDLANDVRMMILEEENLAKDVRIMIEEIKQLKAK